MAAQTRRGNPAAAAADFADHALRGTEKGANVALRCRRASGGVLHPWGSASSASTEALRFRVRSLGHATAMNRAIPSSLSKSWISIGPRRISSTQSPARGRLGQIAVGAGLELGNLEVCCGVGGSDHENTSSGRCCLPRFARRWSRGVMVSRAVTPDRRAATTTSRGPATRVP
jgi:hypothetical protein